MSSQFLSQQNKGLFLKIVKRITAGWSISQIEGTLYLVQPHPPSHQSLEAKRKPAQTIVIVWWAHGSVRLGSLDKTTKGTHRVSDHFVTE